MAPAPGMGSSRLLDLGPWVVLQPWWNGTDNHLHASSAREHDPYYGYGLGSHAESTRKCLSPCAGNWTRRYPIHTHIYRIRYCIEALESHWHKSSTRLCLWLNPSYHLAPTLDAQQRHADLISGFCAITALELSLTKVEAISMNYGKIFRDIWIATCFSHGPHLCTWGLRHQRHGPNAKMVVPPLFSGAPRLRSPGHGDCADATGY